ncbi:8-amino-7-oxononanoate synthase-like isoform X2 [Daucus carota subsp. sativus]|uniref:8-amino-7-oxononanoate synthase-like isoform X2 n=1 Tax=Daucus carota subsp. sativus TaxID=79200 RepID=UPI003082E630
MGLNLHPSLGKASAKAAEEHGMAKRGSTLICGYKNYHRRLETCLGELKKKEGYTRDLSSLDHEGRRHTKGSSIV